MEISVTRQKRIENIEENCTIKNGSRSDEVRASTREITTLQEEEKQSNHPRSPHKQRMSRQVKESRQFIKILGSAVLLFYVSWLPIIVSIILPLQYF